MTAPGYALMALLFVGRTDGGKRTHLLQERMIAVMSFSMCCMVMRYCRGVAKRDAPLGFLAIAES